MRRIFIAMALAAGACSANAAATTWNFSYTGFLTTHRQVDQLQGIDQTTTAFRPDIAIGGTFAGVDDDGDGLISLSELTAFDFDGRDYIGCIAAPSPYGHCSIQRFSYTPGGNLEVSAGWSGNDEFWSGWSGSVTSGVRITDSSYGRFTESDWTYDWTDQTRFSITAVGAPPPVPEPAAAGMTALGVLLLGALARARRAR